MADQFVYPFQAMMEAVAAYLDSQPQIGQAVSHAIGAKHLTTLKTAPYYVWVPDRVTKIKKTSTTGGVDEHRPLMTFTEYCDVYVRGSNFAQTAALRNNLLRALTYLQDYLEKAFTFSLESGQWMGPSKEYNQNGECVKVTIAYEDQVIDEWVNVVTLGVEEPGWVIPSSIETDAYQAEPITEEPGEFGSTIDTD